MLLVDPNLASQVVAGLLMFGPLLIAFWTPWRHHCWSGTRTSYIQMSFAGRGPLQSCRFEDVKSPGILKKHMFFIVFFSYLCSLISFAEWIFFFNGCAKVDHGILCSSCKPMFWWRAHCLILMVKWCQMQCFNDSAPKWKTMSLFDPHVRWLNPNAWC